VKIRPIFRWYDLWVGLYIDRERRRGFLMVLPCLGFLIEWPERRGEGEKERV